MGVASRRPKAAPYLESTKRAASDLYQLSHRDRLEAAALALAVQWYVQSGIAPPGWLDPPGLNAALEKADEELERAAAAAAAAGDSGQG